MAKNVRTGVDRGPNDAGTVWTAVPALQNSWANVAGFQAAQYSRNTEGRVFLRGQIDTGTKTAGTPLFTLPVGHRPVAKETFVVASDVAAGAVATITVDTTGVVSIGPNIAVTAAASISLTPIVFDAA